jgi:hypothetical protein
MCTYESLLESTTFVVGWLVGCTRLVGLVGWLVGWLVGCLVVCVVILRIKPTGTV